FHLNNHLFLALARGDASEVARVMAEYGPHAPPDDTHCLATTGCGCWRRCAPRQTRSNQGCH
ncbi:hypothetical protein C7E17_24355, partial [Stenotrophomonas maltophilia]